MRLSGVIIAKNEEERIADCIDSLSFCNEIIVIDSGSQDKTIDIAKRMGAKVLPIVSSNFSEMRNTGLKKSQGDWVLYVDADERVTAPLRKNIESIINIESKIVAYTLQRKNFHFGTYEWPHVEKLERLFKRNALKGWYGEIHESPKVNGEIGELNGFLLHYTHRNLTEMLEKTIIWSEIEARLRLKAGHPKMTWWRFPRVMLAAFFDSYVRQRGWKAGTVGLIESTYQAFSIFITYAKLWEMQINMKSEK